MSMMRRVIFEETIKSKYTAKNYRSQLNAFLKFLNLQETSQLLNFTSTELQYKLEDYLFDLRKTKNPNSIPSAFVGIRHFCVMNDININWIKLQKMYPAKQKSPSLRAYTSAEVKQILDKETNLRNKALIHFIASTGARIGIFDHDLKIKHLKQMPGGCVAVLLYAGEIEEYNCFLTPQAWKSLQTYHNLLKKRGVSFTDETPLFLTSNKNHTQLSINGARSVISRAVVKSKIIRQVQESRYDIQINHGFRKRFNTILKMNNKVNYNIAEKLMGHKNGLDGVYFTPTLNELFTEFKKVIGRLEV